MTSNDSQDSEDLRASTEEQVTNTQETSDKYDESHNLRRETTRSKIANFYVIAFFSTIGITFLLGACNQFEVKDYRDMLITVSGILSGPLGFIIGYYFKSANSKD